MKLTNNKDHKLIRKTFIQYQSNEQYSNSLIDFYTADQRELAGH